MIGILVLLIVLGLVWWLIGFLPLPAPFPEIIHVVIILCIIYELIAILTGRVPSLTAKWRTQ